MSKKDKRTKRIIIEDGLVNPDEMCIINVPRNKNNTVLYARKREPVNRPIDKPKPVRINAMAELLKDRNGRIYQEEYVETRPKVVPRNERYALFYKAMDNYLNRPKYQADLIIDNAPIRRDKLAKHESSTFTPKDSNTINLNSNAYLYGRFNRDRTESISGNLAVDDSSRHNFVQNNDPFNSHTPPYWQFIPGAHQSPRKTYTIMAPDNRHFKLSKSFDFDREPNFDRSYHSYETEYADIMGGFGPSHHDNPHFAPPVPDKDYYCLFDE